MRTILHLPTLGEELKRSLKYGHWIVHYDHSCKGRKLCHDLKHVPISHELGMVLAFFIEVKEALLLMEYISPRKLHEGHQLWSRVQVLSPHETKPCQVTGRLLQQILTELHAAKDCGHEYPSSVRIVRCGFERAWLFVDCSTYTGKAIFDLSFLFYQKEQKADVPTFTRFEIVTFLNPKHWKRTSKNPANDVLESYVNTERMGEGLSQLTKSVS